MINISRATKQDLGSIQNLMTHYPNKMDIVKGHLNNRDIAVQARNHLGVMVGFAWGGLMANNHIMYIDRVIVHPEYTGHGIVQKMYKFLIEQGLKVGVKYGFGHIRHDAYHDKAAVQALRAGFGSESAPYTLVFAQTENVLKALESQKG